MASILLIATAHAAIIEVPAGDSIASAMSSANSGDEVVVHEGADAGGFAMLSGKTLTVRSATDAWVDVPAMNLYSGSVLTLERVKVPVRRR